MTDLPSAHPGKPVKPFKQECPICHATGSYLKETVVDDLWCCPECRSQFNRVTERTFELVRYKDGTDEAPTPEEISKRESERSEPLKPKQEMIGGMAHSVGTPPFHLIPAVALIELAKQYELGEKIKGKDAWNALSDNQHVLRNKEALAVRLGHVISHAVTLLQDLAMDKELNIRDAAAIMWGGSFAVTSIDARNNAKT